LTWSTATVPTLGDAIEALNDLCGGLAEMLKQIADLSAELAAKDHIPVENIMDMVHDVPSTMVQELDIAQKRNLIHEELEKTQERMKREAKAQLGTIEILLLLVWRHIEYYSDPDNGGRGESWKGSFSTSQTMSTALRFLATPPEPGAFREEVGKRLSPVLPRLSSLNVDYESLGDDWRANQAYIEIMCRRLRDSAGLHDEGQLPMEE